MAVLLFFVCLGDDDDVTKKAQKGEASTNRCWSQTGFILVVELVVGCCQLSDPMLDYGGVDVHLLS